MPRSTPSTTKAQAVKAAASKGAAAKRAKLEEPVHEWEKRLPPYKTPKRSAAPASDKQPRPGSTLRAHPTKSGVWLNSTGTECDHRGISLAFLDAGRQMAEASKAREIEVLGREAVDPLDVLRYGAMDRALPYPLRMEAAGKAVAYTNRKQPMAVDGGADPNNPDGPGLPINISDLKGLDTKELASLKALLEKTRAAGG